MNAEELKHKVKKILEEMGCTDLLFPDPKENLIVAIFNCKNLTSFKGTIEGWTYSGIHLDPTGKRQYKIDFVKNSVK